MLFAGVWFIYSSLVCYLNLSVILSWERRTKLPSLTTWAILWCSSRPEWLSGSFSMECRSLYGISSRTGSPRLVSIRRMKLTNGLWCLPCTTGVSQVRLRCLFLGDFAFISSNENINHIVSPRCSGWSPYVVVAVATGLAAYRFDLPMTVRSGLYEIFGAYTWGWVRCCCCCCCIHRLIILL